MTTFSAEGWLSRMRRRFRPPRRAIPTRPGVFVLIAPIVLGTAAVTAGNNLLFMILGAVLGAIVLSGVISERAISQVEVRVRPLGPLRAGRASRVQVRFERPCDQGPVYGLVFRELPELRLRFRALPGFLEARLPVLEGTSGTAVATRMFSKRGRAELVTCEVSTTHPFGLLHKARDLHVHLDAPVWPAEVELPSTLRARLAPASEGTAGALKGVGSEIFGVREVRPEEHAGRLHALRSAAMGQDVMMETVRDEQPVTWVGIANAGAEPEALDRACELAGAILADRDRRGEPLGLVTSAGRFGPDALPALMNQIALLEPGPRDASGSDQDGVLWLVPQGAAAPPGGGVRVGPNGVAEAGI